MRKVLIATPTYNGDVSAAYSFSLGQTLRANAAGGNAFDFRDYYPRGIVHDARNDAVAMAIHNSFDDLLWIDADQDWEPHWPLELLNYPVDCVGAPVRKKVEKETYNVRCAGGPTTFEIDPDTKLWTCPDMAVGAGFLRLSRRALETLWNAADVYVDTSRDLAERRFIYEFSPVGGRMVSEDILACDKLRVSGVETWLAAHMNPGHIDGSRRWQGDFLAFVRRWMDEQGPQSPVGGIYSGGLSQILPAVEKKTRLRVIG